MSRLMPLWAALSFLTRLVPPPASVTEALLTASVVWYPAAGLAVGLLCTALPWLGLGHGSLLLQGWLYLLISLWATRGLHWDGLADVADAWGSGQRGARFHEILKDSRIGAFGVMALVMGLGGYALLVSRALAAERWAALLLAPVAGRTAVWLLAGLGPPAHPGSALGRIVSRAVSRSLLLSGGLLFVLTGLTGLGLRGCLLLTAGTAVILLFLGQLGRREGGLNGDFFGCAILLTEMVYLAASL